MSVCGHRFKPIESRDLQDGVDGMKRDAAEDEFGEKVMRTPDPNNLFCSKTKVLSGLNSTRIVACKMVRQF